MDVNILQADKKRYCDSMRQIANILYGLIMLVALVGTAFSYEVSQGEDSSPAYVATQNQDAVCEDSLGQGSCQFVATDAASFPDVAPATGSSRYVIAPVSASSRTFAPQRPPP